jgi:hypothetical protein
MAREKGEDMKTNSVLLAVIGLLVLAFGLWVFGNGFVADRIVKVETFQASTTLGVKEKRVFPVYAYPNEGVGSVEAGHDMYIRVDYRNVNRNSGHLIVEDYYSTYGSLSEGQRLDYEQVVDSGSATFLYSYSYVGLHWIALEPDYSPGYNPPIEVSIYTVHYETILKTDFILYGFVLGVVGTVLVSASISVAIRAARRQE